MSVRPGHGASAAAASVVVPTRDRPAPLARCLEALLAQRDIDLEIIVVDDRSVDASAVEAAVRAAGARLVISAGEGPAAARNAGAAAASSDVVLLLDDDSVPNAGWARALADAVLRSGAVAAGSVHAPAGASVWLRASERLAGQVETSSRFFRTLNLGCPRDLLLRVPFDARFVAAAGEDRDWCVRVARAGVSFVREPGARVEHHCTLDARGFGRQQLRYGAAVCALRQRGTHEPVSWRVLCRGLVQALREDPVTAPAMVAGLALVSAGYLREAAKRSG